MLKIADVQKHLNEFDMDGWLIYDFHHLNTLVHEFLELRGLLSRRFFYWIPKVGEPIKIVHQIEPNALDHLPGSKLIYLKWQTLEEHLRTILKKPRRVAMEYSPRNAVPYLSKVDGGVLDLVRSNAVDVVSSGPFLQYFTCIWTDEQKKSHLYAADVLEGAVSKAWKWIADALQKGENITEYDVQQLILKEFDAKGCVANHEPICAVNANSASPHYAPTKEHALPIKKGDFVLIDLWCKQKHASAVYADITRVGVAAEKPTAKQAEVFKVVRSAQRAATDFIEKRYAKGEVIKGYEVDEVARNVIVQAGYGEYFTHRLGHNINTELHGPGAHLDSLETLDDRPLIPRTCFSVEPGIYLPGEFGVRLEHDVFLDKDGKMMITGGVQDELVSLL